MAHQKSGFFELVYQLGVDLVPMTVALLNGILESKFWIWIMLSTLGKHTRECEQTYFRNLGIY